MKTFLFSGLVSVFVAAPAMAQTAPAADPAFAKADAEMAADGPVWKAEAQGGLILTTGNSRSTSVSIGAKASYQNGANKIGLEGTAAYVKSSIFEVNDANGSGNIDSAGELIRRSATITELYAAKARYDRFLTENNSLYAIGLIQRNEPAGQRLLGSGQAGYSRRILKSAMNELVGEIGYDFSYEEFVTGGDITAHSGRLFLGYNGTLSADTSMGLSAEYLGNFNTYSTPVQDADILEDSRVIGKAALTTKLTDSISFRFSFTGRYDNIPAPRPPFGGLSYAPDFCCPCRQAGHNHRSDSHR